jgi:hypothetical protein
MAIELHIFMRDSRIPTTDPWQDAISRAGFPAAFDTSVNMRTHTGFLPATYNGKPTGFEFDLTPTSEFLAMYPHIADRVGDRESCATFRWGGDLWEMCAALSAAASLIKITDGIYFYPDDDILYGADEALSATQRDLKSVVAVDFQKGIVWIKWIGTHRDYDRIDVKKVKYE